MNGSLPILLTVAAIAAGLGGLIAWLIAARGRVRVELELESLKASGAEREAAIEDARRALAAAFQGLASDALEKNSDTFLKLAKENLGRHQEVAKAELSEREKAVEALVKPVTDALKRTEQQLAELERGRKEAYGGIRAHLESMEKVQQALQSETRNLVKALRRPEVRGRWGELHLKRLVELAGMIEHCDFVEQDTSGSEGARMRPDLVVNMPEDRKLVVDVKTPIDAYLDATEASDDAARDDALKRHASQVRARVKDLAAKAYWTQFDPSPDFVVLYLPGDQFLSAALERDPGLQEEALSQGVIMATPSNFMGLLKVVAYGWRQQTLAENAAEIRVLAQELSTRLATFTGHLGKMGRHLRGAVEAYDKGVASLETRVLVQARKITELGVPGKDLDEPERVERSPRLPRGEEPDDD